MTIKRKLFFKEFMGNKKFIAFFSVIMTISFFVSGFEYINFSSSLNTGYRPDVYINGTLSESIYDYYAPVNEAEEYLSGHCGADITVVKSVVRQLASCTEHNSLNSVSYTMRGYSAEYLENSLGSSVASGRLPVTGRNEVVVGSGFAKAMDLTVGDRIDGQFIQLGTIGEIRLFIAPDGLPSPDDFREYTVCGIFTDECSYLDNSAVIEVDDIPEPNAVELIFNNGNAAAVYRAMTDGMPLDNVGEINELYVSKKNEAIKLAADIFSVVCFMLVVMYLMLSLIIKGISKKLSVMKLTGVENGYVVSSFLEGFTIIMLIAIAAALVLLVSVVMLLNNGYSEFVGADVIRFRLDPGAVLFLAGIGAYIELNLLVILKYKIGRIGARAAF